MSASFMASFGGCFTMSQSWFQVSLQNHLSGMPIVYVLKLECTHRPACLFLSASLSDEELDSTSDSPDELVASSDSSSLLLPPAAQNLVACTEICKWCTRLQQSSICEMSSVGCDCRLTLLPTKLPLRILHTDYQGRQAASTQTIKAGRLQLLHVKSKGANVILNTICASVILRMHSSTRTTHESNLFVNRRNSLPLKYTLYLNNDTMFM